MKNMCFGVAVAPEDAMSWSMHIRLLRGTQSERTLMKIG